MSKEKENKFVDVEDPLKGLGFGDEDITETVEAEEDSPVFDAQEYHDQVTRKSVDMSAAAENVKAFFGKVGDGMNKAFKPVRKAAVTPVSKKTALIILGSVAVAAVALCVLVFSLYSGAVYKSGKTADDWANEWNSVSFSDSASFVVFSQTQGIANMEEMFLSDTDHVYLTDADVKALNKGDTVTLFDDLAELSIETHNGDFKSAHISIDYNKLCDHYYGDNYEYDSFTYSIGFFDDSTMRTLGAIAMFVNVFNDTANTEDEILTEAMDLYLRNSPAYAYDGGCRMDVGDYSYLLYYTYEDFLVVTSDSDISASDISKSDISASDAEGVKAIVEQHLIVHVTCTHRTAGEKKHAADWSWWNELFPKKEEQDSTPITIPGELTDPGYDDGISESDASVFSETDEVSEPAE